MKRAIVVVLSAWALVGEVRAEPATWNVDPAHSTVGFSIRHLMISNVRGAFNDFEAQVTGDPAQPAGATVTATIRAASVDTGNEKRDEHLRAADFLDVATHPTITFESTKIEPAGPGMAKVTGNLTLHGVTKEIVLEVVGPTPVITDPWGNAKAGATATTTLSRKDFGITWNKAMDGGGLVVGDEIHVTIELEAQRAAS
jgi:polyisoprenoid-binding protein YceI